MSTQTTSPTSHTVADSQSQVQQPDDLKAVADQVAKTFKHYAHERPEVVAYWCFGLGFLVGWKVKPW